MSQGPLCPNLTQKVQKEVSQMANCNLSCVILLGGLSVNLNHLKSKNTSKDEVPPQEGQPDQSQPSTSTAEPAEDTKDPMPVPALKEIPEEEHNSAKKKKKHKKDAGHGKLTLEQRVVRAKEVAKASTGHSSASMTLKLSGTTGNPSPRRPWKPSMVWTTATFCWASLKKPTTT